MDDLFKMDLIMTYQSWLKNIFYIKNKLKLHILWPQKKLYLYLVNPCHFIAIKTIKTLPSRLIISFILLYLVWNQISY
jgi:hypothetical protein